MNIHKGSIIGAVLTGVSAVVACVLYLVVIVPQLPPIFAWSLDEVAPLPIVLFYVFLWATLTMLAPEN